MVKQIISYLGGKSKIIPDINLHISRSGCKCVVDVFGGSGAILLNVPLNIKSRIYNDLDGELVNLFSVIANHKDELIQKFDYMLVSREIFEKLLSQDLDEIGRAFRTIYSYIYSFSSRRNSDKSFNFGYSIVRKPASFDTIIKRINECYEVVKDWYIEHDDYKIIFNRYNKEGVLFVIDPPYYIEGKNTKYYKHNMNTIDKQIEVFEAIKEIKNAKILITYPQTKFYLDLYKDFNIHQTSKKYSAQTKPNVQFTTNTNELILTNF